MGKGAYSQLSQPPSRIFLGLLPSPPQILPPAIPANISLTISGHPRGEAGKRLLVFNIAT